MKRAKIMLIAIAVIATVGGALAFNAQKYTRQTVYCATKDANNIIYCTNTIFKTTNVAPSFTTPCSTWHALVGANTSSYYTTSTCGDPKVAKATNQVDE